jgi:transcription initiation factor TFIIB
LNTAYGFYPSILKEDDIITTKANHRNAEREIFSEDIRKCPDCGSTDLYVDSQRAEIFCNKCGSVLDESLIDPGAEWRAFDSEQRAKRTRVGAPSTYTISDRGLSTTIDYRNRDSNGRSIPENSRAQMHRMRVLHKRLRVSRAGERNLAFALSELDRESSSLGLKRSVREQASFIYRKAARNNLIRGRSIESVVAATIYTACRIHKIPRTLDEVAEVSKVSKKQIGKNYRFLCRELNIKLKPTSPADYIPRFASKLDVSGEVQSKAIEIIHLANDQELTSGKGPTGLAAAALYIASVLLGERKTQRDIAEISNVTEVTIRNRYKELSEQIDLGVSF